MLLSNFLSQAGATKLRQTFVRSYEKHGDLKITKLQIHCKYTYQESKMVSLKLLQNYIYYFQKPSKQDGKL